ncbi:MAG: hypothetical protein HRT58_10435 [Crocinitomicaceae bacterium]|nr:hypothetical protein [Flavobacteriales bacterium]NQZ36072.1 hypothetical protein [Crocinitomicaceae bacterium]
MVEASFTGLIRTVLIIIGVFIVVRFLGQMMNAKRNMAEQEHMKSQENNLKTERERTAKNLGKTSVIKKGRSSSNDIEDVDFEEIID